ncbi:MAG: tRNA pseudouridine(38-40) synthase TruA [Parachlamydiaceae bacterium]|nr:tRNA pseudouridine(38-40) synthase TruA [Parachlamydiaceae bacterium]
MPGKKYNNLKLVIAYDGTGYKGWQKTVAGQSIEEALQKSIETVCQHPIELQAASRTDAGVHALGQVVNFLTSKSFEDLSLLPVRFNQLLPSSITVLSCENADDDFHPTISAQGKEYHYFVCLGPLQIPHHRLYSWHCPCRPDIELMRLAAQQLVGYQDFSAFCNFHANSRYSHFEREVASIEIIKIDTNRLCFVVKGHSFLYKMVRNLVGTIINIGQGKIGIDRLPAIIAAKDRKEAGISAPAQGLFLKSIYY